MNEQLMQQFAMFMAANGMGALPAAATAPVVETQGKAKRPPVKLVYNKDTKAAYTAYQNNPEYGYIQVEEAQIQLRSLTWVGKTRRVALIKGDVESLKTWVLENAKGGKLPGQIVVREYEEGAVPDELYRELIGDTEVRDYEEAVKPFIKLAGKDGVPLTIGGNRILRFSFYDETGELEDIKVQHDNSDDVASAARERRIEKMKEVQAELEAKAALAEAEKKVSKTAEPVVASLPDNNDTGDTKKK